MEINSETRKIRRLDTKITQKSFRKGSTCPPATNGLMRLYNMRFCPYAERTVLVLEAKKIPHEVVNIHLKEKPEWYLEKYPEAKVPAIEIDGDVIGESLILCDYLDETFADPPLYPKDTFQKAKDKMIIGNFSKVEAKFAPLYSVMKGDCTEALQNLEDQIDFFEKELNCRGTKFFLGDKPGMVDYMIWPFFERLYCFHLLAKTVTLSKKKFPTLTAWVDHMLSHPVVSKVAFPAETMAEYYKARVEGVASNFDLGL